MKIQPLNVYDLFFSLRLVLSVINVWRASQVADLITLFIERHYKSRYTAINYRQRQLFISILPRHK